LLHTTHVTEGIELFRFDTVGDGLPRFYTAKLFDPSRGRVATYPAGIGGIEEVKKQLEPKAVESLTFEYYLAEKK
jgi:hypothetical protein